MLAWLAIFLQIIVVKSQRIDYSSIVSSMQARECQTKWEHICQATKKLRQFLNMLIESCQGMILMTLSKPLVLTSVMQLLSEISSMSEL